MARRYSLVEYDDATPDVQAIYDDYLKITGSPTLPVWIKSLGNNKVLMHAYWERVKGSLLTGSLPMVLKELVMFVVSLENGAPYCTAAHAHSVLSLDPTLRYEKLQNLLLSLRSEVPLEGDLAAHRAALQFALHVAKDASHVADDRFNALIDAEYSRDEIAELISVIDLSSMFNVYTSALQLPLDPEYRAVRFESDGSFRFQ